jgi:GH25 family lysozyme M1 (1,4-beta-N-acetylmuramidase)
MTKGIDVFQKYQGAINWAQVYASGVRMVFVKLSNGTSVASPAGDTYVVGAHRAGLLVGGYAYVLGGSAAAQADAFAKELIRLNALDLAPTLDFEDSGLPATATARRTWIIEFFTELKKKLPGLSKVLLYASGSQLATMITSMVKVPGLTIEIWDAEYGPNNGAEHPVTHYTSANAIHQYSSTGHVPGISGQVDVDTVNEDITHPVTPSSPVVVKEPDMAFTAEQEADIVAMAMNWRVGVAGQHSAGALSLALFGIPSTTAGLIPSVSNVDVDALAAKLSAVLGPDLAKALGAKLSA